VPTRQLITDFLRPSCGDAESPFGRHSAETGLRNNDGVDDCRAVDVAVSHKGCDALQFGRKIR